MSFLSTVAPVLIVICLLVLDILCADISRTNNAGLVNVNNGNWTQAQNQNIPFSQWGSKDTTPWPALGHQRNNFNANIPNTPTWVRPNQRPNINTQRQYYSPSSNRNSPNSNFNTGSQLGASTQGNRNASPADVKDNDLRELSETLLSKDVNNAAKYVTINLQGKTTSWSHNDEAPLPLLAIDQKTFDIPSIEKMLRLHNNYVIESNVGEDYTTQEKNEEDSLLDTILGTEVMQHTKNFLVEKGVIGSGSQEFRDKLREIWFDMYARGGRKVGSSGFEHVFLAEIKNNQISGLHNWLYFNEEEKNNRANYLGYMKKIDLGNKGAILKYHFTLHGIDKPVGSMFIGTSPEFEMALYTTCFLLRADGICPMKLNGNKFIIRTFTYRYKGKKMIGSAFPEI